MLKSHKMGICNHCVCCFVGLTCKLRPKRAKMSHNVHVHKLKIINGYLHEVQCFVNYTTLSVTFHHNIKSRDVLYYAYRIMFSKATSHSSEIPAKATCRLP